MTGKIEVTNLDNLIRRYQAGEPSEKLLGEFGISKTTLYRTLRRNGVPANPRLKPLPVDEIVSRYIAGESELSLSKTFGIDRNGIRRRLLQSGITPRNGSQASIISMSRMTPSQRKARASAAHEAVRGRYVPIKEREQRANTRERHSIGGSLAESILSDMLKEKGIMSITPQKAIGVYNVDIAIESCRIAIEIFGGSWHLSSHHSALHQKRIPYIRNKGWTVVIIWVNARHYPLTIDAADYIISLTERLRFNKPAIGEYHVIRGNGELVPVLSCEFNCNPIVKCPTSRDKMGRFHSNIR
jgi:very-short-patch-repair endonuclease